MTTIKIIETGDGSQSLYHDALNETYHSTHGALTESQHVFIRHGLDYLKGLGKEHVRILEVGFGTGLNALLVQAYAASNETISVDYVTLEPLPLDAEIIAKLTYHEQIGNRVSKNDFLRLHDCNWGEAHQLAGNFNFTKHQATLQNFQATEGFDLVFYDAFAPSKQAEMWEFQLLEHLRSLMIPEAVLVTYCARGQFKRDLAALGMKVETLPGPPGKKEMVRGSLMAPRS